MNEFYIVNSSTGRIVDGFPSFAEAEQECAWWCEQRQQMYVVRELPALSFHEMLAHNRRMMVAHTHKCLNPNCNIVFTCDSYICRSLEQATGVASSNRRATCDECLRFGPRTALRRHH